MASQIAFVCVAKRHGAARDSGGAVTIHQGLWAFCAGSSARDDHDWQPTGGVTLEQLLARRIVLHEAATRV